MNGLPNVSKHRQFIFLFAILLLTACNSSEKKNEVIEVSDEEIKHTYREMINQPLFVNFGESRTYEILFKSDSSFFWKSTLREAQGDEKTRTIVLDDHRVLTHWVEKDSTVVCILSDFENMTINGFETFGNMKTIYLIGEMSLMEQP